MSFFGGPSYCFTSQENIIARHASSIIRITTLVCIEKANRDKYERQLKFLSAVNFLDCLEMNV